MNHTTEHDTGITTIDTGFFRPRFDAAYPVSYTHLRAHETGA